MFQNLMLRVVSAWKPVKLATTDQEREAIYRLRHRIYVAERGISSADPSGEGRVHQPADDEPGSYLFYIGAADAPEATVRMRAYPAGQIPRDVWETYSLHLLPTLETRPTFEANFLMTEKTQRGSMNAVSLMIGAFEHVIRDTGAEVLIADCVPGLLTAYKRLGMRTYGGRLVPFSDGVLVPVVGIAADVEHFRRLDSPLLSSARRMLKEKRYANTDIGPLLEVLDVEEPAAMRVSESLNAIDDTFLDRLSPATAEHLKRVGFVLDVSAGDPLVVKDAQDREMFLILSGMFEAHIGDRVLGRMQAGELFGEVAFFRPEGQRSASVRCSKAGQVLALRRSVVEKMKKQNPTGAFELLEALAGSLADRIASGRTAPFPEGS